MLIAVFFTNGRKGNIFFYRLQNQTYKLKVITLRMKCPACARTFELNSTRADIKLISGTNKYYAGYINIEYFIGKD